MPLGGFKHAFLTTVFGVSKLLFFAQFFTLFCRRD
jgi:hypothetical protein